MNDRFGMNVHTPGNYPQLDLCRELSVGWVRVDFGWHEMEPARHSPPVWGTWDRFIADFQKAGIQIYGSISYSPTWANGGRTRGYPPLNGADFAAFVEKVVGRYKASIQHWGIWNEPNLAQFYNGTRDEYLTRILTPGIDGILRANPAAKVVGPDLAHRGNLKTKESWYEWLQAILAREGKRIGIISHHVYKIPSRFELWWNLEGPEIPFISKKCLRPALSKFKCADKPVWITETGWRSDDIGEKKQADYYAQFFDGIASRTWIQKVFLYHLKDGPGEKEQWGLISSADVRKKAFDVVKKRVAQA